MVWVPKKVWYLKSYNENMSREKQKIVLDEKENQIVLIAIFK